MAGRVTTQLIVEGVNRTRQMFNEVNRDLNVTNKALAASGKLLAGYLTFSALAAGVKAVANTADAYQAMNARLRLATGSQEEFNTALEELQRIAYNTGQPVEALVTLYGRISRPLKEAGRTQQDILKVTEAVSASFRVSGASAVEAENGVIQFGQALGAGALRGDEFNSVAEQAPRLMQALADGIGVPTSALKALAAEGKLTAAVVTDALIGQLPKLQSELASFGDSVSKEWTAIEDTIRRGVGQADTGPLIESLKELKDVLADPTIQGNLTTLASALVRLAAAAAKGGSLFSGFGEDLGYLAARVTGNVTELDRVNKEIQKLQAAEDGFGLVDLFMSDAQISERLTAFKKYREQLLEEQTGMTAEARKAAEEAAAQVKAVDDARQQAALSSERAYSEALRQVRDGRLKAVQDSLKKQEAAEKGALAAVEKVRNDRLAIEKRYSEAIAGLQAGVGGDPSYASAQTLKQSAAQALRKGDAETAQAQAQKALEMLQQLQAAGENTYGFTGFAKELQAIELAANDLQQSQADAKLDSIRARIAELSDAATALQGIEISFNLPPEEIEAIKAQLQALSETPVLIPVQLVPTGEMSAVSGTTPPVSFPGYATGTNSAAPGIAWVGERGPELVAFGGAEKVFPNSVSALASRLAGMRGLDGLSPAAAEVATSAPSSGQLPNLGRIDLSFGGSTVSVFGDQRSVNDILRLQALKRGRTARP
ncbi:tape measure protein [Pseudomonas aeruginosa]|uniref:tape measure protein n=1 Tax=Pseudomonas aeruginosa TaxID=287 RepID=UPI001CBE6140|nr:tape measure protein [Pseudomonas aeruginosa]HBO4546350.1 tape measure protein [Pseudomonas aeruginosa]